MPVTQKPNKVAARNPAKTSLFEGGRHGRRVDDLQRSADGGVISKQYIAEIRLKREAVGSFDKYPFSLAAVRPLERLELHPAVTFFVGENGSGKSTLLEAIAVACGFNAEGGSKNFRFGTRESHSELHRYLSVARGVPRPRDGFFLRAESFFNVATEIEKLDAEPGAGPPIGPSYGQRPLHEQSHGESFLALLLNRFRGEGLYLLDEPEAALSPSRQLSVITRIHDLVQENSQFIIATHSPILMAYPHAFIYAFSFKGIERIVYEKTEHYRVTRDFLSNPKRMLHVLLAP
jgi:predicted ATPase